MPPKSCPTCGETIPADAVFCIECGAPIPGTSASPAVGATVQFDQDVEFAIPAAPMPAVPAPTVAGNIMIKCEKVGCPGYMESLPNYTGALPCPACHTAWFVRKAGTDKQRLDLPNPVQQAKYDAERAGGPPANTFTIGDQTFSADGDHTFGTVAGRDITEATINVEPGTDVSAALEQAGLGRLAPGVSRLLGMLQQPGAADALRGLAEQLRSTPPAPTGPTTTGSGRDQIHDSGWQQTAGGGMTRTIKTGRDTGGGMSKSIPGSLLASRDRAAIIKWFVDNGQKSPEQAAAWCDVMGF